MPSVLDGLPTPDAPGSSDADLVPYSEIEALDVEWVIPGLIPAGMLSVLAGEQGLGKSMLHVAWASQLSSAGHSSILVSTEDSPQYTTKRRLVAAQAEQHLVRHCVNIPELGNGNDAAWLLRIKDWIRETHCRFMVLDPFVSVISTAADSYKDQHIRRIMKPLGLIAEETQCAIMFVMHMTKGASLDPLIRVSGAGAFTQGPRSVVLVTKRDGSANERIIAHVKCNVAELAQPQLWEVEPILIPPAAKTARIVYRGQIDVDIYQLLAAPPSREEKTERNEAEEIILSMLSDDDGCPSMDLERAVRESGISGRTYDRARSELGVRGVKRGKIWWSVLSQSHHEKKDATRRTPPPPLASLLPSNHAGLRAEETKDALVTGNKASLTVEEVGRMSLSQLREHYSDELDK